VHAPHAPQRSFFFFDHLTRRESSTEVSVGNEHLEIATLRLLQCSLKKKKKKKKKKKRKKETKDALSVGHEHACGCKGGALGCKESWCVWLCLNPKPP